MSAKSSKQTKNEARLLEACRKLLCCDGMPQIVTELRPGKTGSDLPHVMRIQADCFTPEQRLRRSDIHRAMREYNAKLIVGTLSGKVMSYMLHDAQPHRLELLTMAVDPYLQRRGVGTMFVRYLKGLLGPRPQSILTHVPEDNLPAAKFFANLGFTSVLLRDFVLGEDGKPACDAYRFEFRHPAGVGVK
jgi:ribosomal protein S18 acetylase RimI-like enzyme